MYLRRIWIQNIRSIQELEWRSPATEAGWHVILGDNGSGKSSFLRAVALALIGTEDALALRQDWSSWLRIGAAEGGVFLGIAVDHEYDQYTSASGGLSASGTDIGLSTRLVRSDSTVVLRFTNRLARPLWAKNGGGWFSAAYGPFRRFTGGNREFERILHSNPRLAAHVSVFGENVALAESLTWLRDLNYKKLERSALEGHLLDRLIQFVNQDGFLPHNMRLKEVSSRGVEFSDANGFPVAVEELSDGYRSILSMTFELVRQLVNVYSEDRIFDSENRRVVVPGVVMIDEIDAHLHPTWQKRIGFWLTAHFPQIQFLVTTHSPLICQAAINGSIFRLPTPGSAETGRMLEGPDSDRLLYGDILDAYSTEAFGTADTRSSEAHEKQERLAELNVREISSGLSDLEKMEQEKLRSAFPTTPHVTAEQLVRE